MVFLFSGLYPNFHRYLSPFLRQSNYLKVHEHYPTIIILSNLSWCVLLIISNIITTCIDDINYRKSAVIWSCEQGRGWISVANAGEMEVVALRAVCTPGPSSQYQVAPCHVEEVWPWFNINVLMLPTIKR